MSVVRVVECVCPGLLGPALTVSRVFRDHRVWGRGPEGPVRSSHDPVRDVDEASIEDQDPPEVLSWVHSTKLWRGIQELTSYFGCGTVLELPRRERRFFMTGKRGPTL